MKLLLNRIAALQISRIHFEISSNVPHFLVEEISFSIKILLFLDAISSLS
jgi:hypothetical protein